MEVIITGFGALVVGFYYSWKLTLLLLAFIPLLILGGFADAMRFQKAALKERKSFAEASHVRSSKKEASTLWCSENYLFRKVCKFFLGFPWWSLLSLKFQVWL